MFRPPHLGQRGLRFAAAASRARKLNTRLQLGQRNS